MAGELLHEFQDVLPDPPNTGQNAGAIMPSHWVAPHVQDTEGVQGAAAPGHTKALTAEELKVFVLAALGLSGWDRVVVEDQLFIRVTLDTDEQLLLGPFE